MKDVYKKNTSFDSFESLRFNHSKFLDICSRQFYLALVTISASGVVFTLAMKFSVLLNALVGVSIADTSSTDFDIFDSVKVSLHYFLRKIGRHQVAVKSVELEEPNSNFGSAGEFLEFFRSRKRVLAWPTVDKRHDNFTISSGNKFSVLENKFIKNIIW